MKYVVTVNDKNYEVEVEKGEARVLSIANAALNVTQTVQAPIAAASAAPAPAAATPAVDQPGTALAAPMPGTILSVLKKTGDRVKAGDIVLILEAMKMENEIVAMTDGTISQVLVSKGASVTTGDPLVLIV